MCVCVFLLYYFVPHNKQLRQLKLYSSILCDSGLMSFPLLPPFTNKSVVSTRNGDYVNSISCLKKQHLTNWHTTTKEHTHTIKYMRFNGNLHSNSVSISLDTRCWRSELCACDFYCWFTLFSQLYLIGISRFSAFVLLILIYPFYFASRFKRICRR